MESNVLRSGLASLLTTGWASRQSCSDWGLRVRFYLAQHLKTNEKAPNNLPSNAHSNDLNNNDNEDLSQNKRKKQKTTNNIKNQDVKAFASKNLCGIVFIPVSDIVNLCLN
jgi:hypothetical protein